MKKYISFILILLFFGCSEEVIKPVVYNAEAFAFKIDSEWELNASAQVKGFQQIEENDRYISKLSYYTNLVTPSGEVLEEVDYGLIDKESQEELIDLQLDIQIILDESFQQGKYVLQIFINDDLSGLQDSTKVKFDLSE